MSDPLRIAMVGGGVMGGAIAEGFLDSTIDDRPVDVRVVEADRERARYWQDRGVRVAELADAAGDADVVFLAVKPHQIHAVLDRIAPSLGEHSIVVSIAAGIPLQALQAPLGPGAAVIRTMPNTPVRVGKGVIGLAVGSSCTPAQVSLVRRLLEPNALTVEVPEGQLDALTATSGSGPAYVFYLAEAMLRGARELGLPADTAALLVAETITGAAELLAREPENAEGLRKSVTSKGGTTAAAIDVFERAGVREIVSEAMQANVRRSQEMADERE